MPCPSKLGEYKRENTRMQWCVSPETNEQKFMAGGLHPEAGYWRVFSELAAEVLYWGLLVVALSPPALCFIQLAYNLFGQGPPVLVCLTSIMRYWFCLDVTIICVLFISYKFWESWLFLVVLLNFVTKQVSDFYHYEFGLHSKDFFFYYLTFCFCSSFRFLTLKTALHLSLRFQAIYFFFWMLSVVVKRRNVIIWMVHRKHVLWLLFLQSLQCKLL